MATKQVFKPNDYAFLPDDVSGYVVVQVGPKGFTAGDVGVSVTPVSSHPMEPILLTKEQCAQLEMCTDAESVTKTVEDMVRLNDLREATLLHNLRERFFVDEIYTKIGSILVSVNPFKMISGLYSPDTLEAYAAAADRKAEDGGNVLPPHVYQVADQAYRAMVSERESQACLVSGESGAGKTEATKVLLQFLTEMSAKTASEDWGEQGRLQEQILKANPLMEAFGNAKTVRNGNSSRFGKYVDVKFNSRLGTIIGGTITQYLLEKSRIVSQGPGERNYHIFYQLCAGCAADTEFRKRYLVQNADQYAYLARSDESYGINDDRGWEDTIQAMTVLGMSSQERDALLRTVAAILHLGNVTFVEKKVAGVDQACEIQNPQTLEVVAFQLGVPAAALAQALTQKSIQAREQNVYQYYNLAQAADCRDTISKAIYGNMFDWLIRRINWALKAASRAAQLGQQLAHGGTAAGTVEVSSGGAVAGSGVLRRLGSKQDVSSPSHEDVMSGGDNFLSAANGDAVSAIGVLDIFGFESFQTNSFEQLCINYCNEKLQGYFTENIFKLEQQQYKEEGIDVTLVAFKDNQEVLEMLENRREGLFAMIDEELSVPKGTDETFLSKAVKRFEKSAYFKRSVKSKAEFVIVHFAGEVTYTVTGFLTKNKDVLPADVVGLLEKSTHRFIRALFFSSPEEQDEKKKKASTAPSLSRATAVGTVSGGSKRSLIAQFKTQLDVLMSTLRATAPHFIRCVKPNKQLKGNIFDGPMVLEQLRYAGLLEVCKIRKAGFPVRKDHRFFAWRYGALLGRGTGAARGAGDARSVAEALERRKFLLPHEWKAGKTKMFMRTEAYDRMERARETALAEAATTVQAAARGKMERKHYKEMKALLGLIERATKNKALEEIEALLLRTGELPNQGRHLKQIHAARKMMQQVEEERRVEQLLVEAITAEDLESIERAIFAAEQIKYTTSPSLAPGRALVAELREERKLKEAFTKALNDQNVKELSALLAQAKKLPKFSTRGGGEVVFQRAERMVARAEQETNALNALRKAIETKNMAQIKSSIDLLDAMGVGAAQNPLVAEGMRVAQVSEEENSKGARAREQLVADAEKALAAKDLRLLQAVQTAALETGMLNGKSSVVDEAMKMLAALEKNSQVGLVLSAERKALAVKQARSNGIVLADVTDLEKAVAEARAQGVPDSDVEMSRALAAISRAKKQVEIQAKLKSILADPARVKDYLVLKGALAECEGIGMDSVESVVEIKEKVLQLESDGKGAIYEERPKLTTEMDEDAIEQLNRGRLEKAAGPGYHFGNFYKLRSDADFARGILFNKNKPIHLKLAHQNEPIHKSLLECSAETSRQAVRLNRSILGYCGDVVMSFPASLAQDVVDKVIVFPELADEVYVQLCKHLTGNNDPQSVGRAWQLICIFAGAFPPSVQFELYFLNFLLRYQTAEGIIGTYAQYAVRRLQSTILFGPTSTGVDIEEIVSYGDRPPILATILLTDGTPITEKFPVPPHMNVDDVLRICTEFLALSDKRGELFGMFAKENERKGMENVDEAAYLVVPPPPPLEAGDMILADLPPPPPLPPADDVLAAAGMLDGADAALPPPPPPEMFDEAEDIPPRTMYPLPSASFLGDIVLDMARSNRGETFVFKRKFFLPGTDKAGKDPVYNRLLYLQVLDEAFNGNWHTPTKELAVKLAAIAMVVDLGGDDFPKTEKGLVREGLVEYIPPYWRSKQPLQAWATEVLAKSREYLKTDLEDLQLQFLATCRDELPQYGSTVFFARKLPHGSDYLLCVFYSQVQLLNLHDRQVVTTVRYDEMRRCAGSSRNVVFDTVKQGNVTFWTSQGKEIADFIAEYQEITGISIKAPPPAAGGAPGSSGRKTVVGGKGGSTPAEKTGIDLNTKIPSAKISSSNKSKPGNEGSGGFRPKSVARTQAAANEVLGVGKKKAF